MEEEVEEAQGVMGKAKLFSSPAVHMEGLDTLYLKNILVKFLQVRVVCVRQRLDMCACVRQRLGMCACVMSIAPVGVARLLNVTISRL